MRSDILCQKAAVNDGQLILTLAQLRREKGLTQTQLAQLVGCDTRTIQNLEAGKGVSDELKELVSDVLGYTLQKNWNLIPKGNEK